MVSTDGIIAKTRAALIEVSQTHHRYPLAIAQAEKLDWDEDFSSGYKGLYYFVPVTVSPDYKCRVRVAALDTPMVRKVSSQLFRQLRGDGVRDIGSILTLCNALLAQWSWEYRTIAFDWSYRVRKEFEPHHFSTLEYWATLYLSTWGSVDDFCTHTLGYFFFTFPEFTSVLQRWATSKNPWILRTAAVSLIYGLRRGAFLECIFDVADAMLTDPRRYVQNGYGWMLKEATKHFQDQVFEYVMSKKDKMPRRALRYAIEKMPQTLKKQAMA